MTCRDTTEATDLISDFSDLDHNTRGFLKNLFINPWVDG